jgi:hypothetical protein
MAPVRVQLAGRGGLEEVPLRSRKRKHRVNYTITAGAAGWVMRIAGLREGEGGSKRQNEAGYRLRGARG